MKGEIREAIGEALSMVDRPGSFCVSGAASAVLPGLEVAGLGSIGLPLTAGQAKELIEHCHRAPYGKGEQTIVDKSVRRVWRMSPDRFSLTNPDWTRFIGEAIARVQEGLGLEKQKLGSHLHDLLLYQPGGFFLPHRDGEKLDRMVATLVIVLPSTYEGGELVVRHDGQERTIDFRGVDLNPFHIYYAAFYADCEHEIRPLRKGHRLCLVYNLTLATSPSVKATWKRTRGTGSSTRARMRLLSPPSRPNRGSASATACSRTPGEVSASATARSPSSREADPSSDQSECRRPSGSRASRRIVRVGRGR